MKFTGERFIPLISPERIRDDHIERYNFAAKYVKEKNVLDISCGVGYGSSIMKRSGAIQVTGVDICPKSISYARINYNLPKLIFETGNIERFSTHSKVDVVVCFETIEHVGGFAKAISNIYKSLKHEGILLISSPNRTITSPAALTMQSEPKNRFHTQEFTIEELSNILSSSGFPTRHHKVFGQRQCNSIQYNKAKTGKFNPKIECSPKVELVTSKIPRYFIILAMKI